MRSEDSRLLAGIIRKQRILHGFMQTELSQLSGIPAFKISRVERGHSFPSAEFLIKISGILGMDRSQLLMCAALAALGDHRVNNASLHNIITAFHDNSGRESGLS